MKQCVARRLAVGMVLLLGAAVPVASAAEATVRVGQNVGKLAFNVKDELKRKWERRTRLQMHEQEAQKTAGAYPDITPQLTGKYAPAAR